VKEVGTSLDKMCLPRDSEEGGGMLLLAWIISALQGWGEVLFDCTGRGRLTRRLTHSLGIEVVSVEFVVETGVLGGVLVFGGMNTGFRGPIEADGLSFDDVGVRRGLGQTAIGDVMLQSSQDVILSVGEGAGAKSRRVRANLLVPRLALFLSDSKG